MFTHALDMLVSLLNAMSGELLNTSAAEDVKRSSVVKKLMVSVFSLAYITLSLFPDIVQTAQLQLLVQQEI